MEIEKMKNMVVLKNLPSNIVEEAIVILKPNKKIEAYNHTNGNGNGKASINKKEKNYIINEAEMVISNYLFDIERKRKERGQNEKKMANKYKKLKGITYFLGIALLINIILSCV